ncbi:MAG: fumarate reductase subunit C [Oceanisphaera sp.]|uniref:fumarate reductase subunit C n=1 Tax=Oceanisphaera sp. TaxID=1929979 RepID=UPI003F946237
MSYRPTLSRTWWLKNNAFKAYMLREATVLPLTFFLLCLSAGLYSLGQGESQWQSWQGLMALPPVLAINGLALLASLFHAWTFFELFPRVMPIRIGSKVLPPTLLIAGQWLGVFMMILLFGYLFGGAQ